jgi:hypothetical protein
MDFRRQVGERLRVELADELPALWKLDENESRRRVYENVEVANLDGRSMGGKGRQGETGSEQKFADGHDGLHN